MDGVGDADAPRVARVLEPDLVAAGRAGHGRVDGDGELGPAEGGEVEDLFAADGGAEGEGAALGGSALGGGAGPAVSDRRTCQRKAVERCVAGRICELAEWGWRVLGCQS